MATIRIISPDGLEQTVELERHNTLGRHSTNSIQILDSIVSKNHCHIVQDERGEFVLRDLGSRNGSFVNRDRVSGERALEPGDEISIGSTRIHFGPHGKTDAGLTGEAVMTTGRVESQIRARLSQPADQHFAPERLVQDVPALRRDYEKLRVSFELTRALAGELDVDRVLEKILTTAFQALPADRGVVLLLDQEGVPKPRCALTRHGEHAAEVVLSKTIINEVLRDRAAVLSSDALSDARFKGAQSIVTQGIRSSMAVPLVHADTLLGVMVLDSQAAADAFSEKDLQLTQALANQAALMIQNSLYAAKIEQEALTRQRLQRLLSPAIAELVVRGEVEVVKGGQTRQTTVFFSDIRGFTAMSEKHTAQQIVDMLNEYFELMVEHIFEWEGTLDKFVGDEIMALFGAPVYHDDDAYRAVKVAVDQLDALDAWNRVRVAAGDDPIGIGIGINTGEVIAGYLGSSRSLEYTVIGDVVNTASRLCAVARAGQIIISRSTYEQVKDRFEVEELPPAQLKGKALSQDVFSVKREK